MEKRFGPSSRGTPENAMFVFVLPKSRGHGLGKKDAATVIILTREVEVRVAIDVCKLATEINKSRRREA